MKVLCVLSRYAYGKPWRGENYDYVHFLPAFRGLGHEVEFFDSGNRALYRDFAELNLALVRCVAAWQPDVIFCVLMHYEIWFETLDLIRANSPAVIVNWGTDDSWKFEQASRFFSEHVDLHITTDDAAAAAAAARGLGNVVLSQWAASSASFSEPCPSQSCRYDVSFVGSLYGYRAVWIERLRASGINVACFGHGTENGVVDAGTIPEIYRTSRVSLNFSGAGQGRGHNRQIKARTFEVPGAGGFLLTEVSPDLERYFAPGREIATFATPDQLVAQVRYYLDHPDQRDAIAQGGHTRTTAAHSYEQRFSNILRKLGPLRAGRQGQPWTLSVDALQGAVARYRRESPADWLRPMLVAPLSILFGSERGPRAARRLIFELSWRLGGATTFCAAGLPGRLFYGES